MKPNYTIPFFDYSALFLRHQEEYLKILSQTMSRGAFILQEEIREFEKNLAQFLGVKHAIAVSSCTDGLILALLACGIKPGDEVILPSHTMVGTPDAVRAVGAIPVLAECGSDHLIDVDHASSLISHRVKAIVPVHLNGRTADVFTLNERVFSEGIPIIEDAAQAFGAKFKEKNAGTFGTVGAFSFYPAKILGSFGDAGAVVTESDVVARELFLLRNHGCDPEGIIRRWGLNARMDNIQAAILNFNLHKVKELIFIRRKLAKLYHESLFGISELVLPPPPEDGGDYYDVFQNYEIEAEDRDNLRNYLKRQGIGTLLPWGGKAIHQWEDLGFNCKLPRTDRVFERALLLPMNPMLSEDDIFFISHKVRDFYGS